MALPLFALSMSACGDDSSNKDSGTVDQAVKQDGGTQDFTTPTGGDAGEDGGGTGFPAPPTLNAQIDRMGRAGVNTALTDPFWDDGVQTAAGHHAKQDAYNAAATPASWGTLTLSSATTTVTQIFEGTVAVYDALSGSSDGTMSGDGCGDQLAYNLTSGSTNFPGYSALATVLTNDKLFINSTSGTCTAYLGVEANALGVTNTDCGGRTPLEDTIDITYTALADGALVTNTCLTTATGACAVNDGVSKDPDSTPTTNAFPFLAAVQ